MSVQDAQYYFRAANSAREYYNRVTNKQEEKDKEDDGDGTFATIGKIGF
jgi:hypothetical protein